MCGACVRVRVRVRSDAVAPELDYHVVERILNSAQAITKRQCGPAPDIECCRHLHLPDSRVCHS